MASLHNLAFEFPWGYSGPRVARSQDSWALLKPIAAKNTLSYSLPSFSVFRADYAIRTQIRHRLAWGELKKVSKKVTCLYGDMQLFAKSHRIDYGDRDQVRSRVSVPYDMKSGVAQRNEGKYALLSVTYHNTKIVYPWALTSAEALYHVDNNPVVVYDGNQIDIDNVEVSCDEGSSVWIARFNVLRIEEFSLLPVLGQVTMSLALPSGVESFVFVVDSKNISRSLGDVVCTVTAKSPLGLMDNPYSHDVQYINQTPIDARTLVERFIGPVTWNLPDWFIPAAVAAFTGMSPLSAANRIVQSVGGTIESSPDGSVVCRLLHVVDVPGYTVALVDHAFFDHEVMTSEGNYGYSSLFNRVIVSNEDTQTYTNDRLEEVAHPVQETNTTLRRVRAYLSYQRAVGLVHTGNPATVITPLGEQVRYEEELVEFIDGIANVQYQIDSIDPSSVWQHTNLGAIVFAGSRLVASISGCSLYKIKYAVKSVDWDVSLPEEEAVQFLLVDL